MRIEQIKSTVMDFYNSTKRPIVITGACGGGKTSVVNQVAEELGISVIHKHMPTMLVEDFGIPYPSTDGDSFDYRLPDWFPKEGNCILLLDDRGQCGADLQKIIANLQQARELHGHKLSDGCMIVSTSNRVEDKSGVNRTLLHLADRETELELDTNLDDWCKWAIDNDVKPELISFIRFRTDLLHNFDPQQPKSPTPRSWVEGVSNILGIISSEIEYECFKGAVGEGASAEFVGYMKIWRKLPNIDNILLHPDKADVPTDPATLYAISGSLADRANDNNFSKCITYFDRMPAEFGVLGVSYATRKNPDLASTQAFTKWAVANQDVLF